MDRNTLFIVKKGSQPSGESYQIGLEETLTIGLKKLTAEIVKPEEVIFDAEKDIAFLDMSGLDTPLSFRLWRNGDRFRPLGMTGHKNVSDYLIDKKVPLAEKDEVYVLISNNQIIWLAGYQIDDGFKVTADTRQVLKISFR